MFSSRVTLIKPPWRRNVNRRALREIILRKRASNQRADRSGRGIAKSWISRALGHRARRDSYSVLCQRVPKLFAELASARGTSVMHEILSSLGSLQLLIIDDCGRTICWRFLKSAKVDDQQSAPASSPWTDVTLSSEIPPTQMPSLIASFTTLIALGSDLNSSLTGASLLLAETRLLVGHRQVCLVCASTKFNSR